eukprot:2385545-Rhodomonas_salina.1
MDSTSGIVFRQNITSKPLASASLERCSELEGALLGLLLHNLAVGDDAVMGLGVEGRELKLVPGQHL